MEEHYTARGKGGHWHAAATTVHASYIVLKKRSGLSWARSLASLSFGAELAVIGAVMLCACAHTPWAGGGATLRGGAFFCEFMRTLDHPRILLQRNNGIDERKLPACRRTSG